MRVGVVVPAHDEEALLAPCLEALRVASDGLDVTVLVVLDSCTDGSQEVCDGQGVAHVELSVRSAGHARAAGFARLLAELGPDAWLASTDADSRVAPDWISQQLALAAAGADAVFGVVDVDDWGVHAPHVAARFQDLYAGTSRDDVGSHAHRHGASFGLRASTYTRIGGIPLLAVGEDQALSDRLTADPTLNVVASTAVRVATSARLHSRVEGGFASLLAALA